jgi:hypothetical protein
VLRLRISGAIPLLPLYALIASMGTTLIFIFTDNSAEGMTVQVMQTLKEMNILIEDCNGQG